MVNSEHNIQFDQHLLGQLLVVRGLQFGKLLRMILDPVPEGPLQSVEQNKLARLLDQPELLDDFLQQLRQTVHVQVDVLNQIDVVVVGRVVVGRCAQLLQTRCDSIENCTEVALGQGVEDLRGETAQSDAAGARIVFLVYRSDAIASSQIMIYEIFKQYVLYMGI